MADSNVIPFRRRAPSDGEMEAYRRFTRSWTAELKQLMFPEYFQHESNGVKTREQRLLPSPV
jgi:hypothetical protein